jgi:hypothetical protein
LFNSAVGERKNQRNYSWRKNEYHSSQPVKDFNVWIEPLLDTPQSFVHEYFNVKKRKKYEFDNLFTAYKLYDWKPIDDIAASLVKSISESDEQSCVNACSDMLEWGLGKSKAYHDNMKRVINLSPSPCTYFRLAQERLELSLSSGEYFFPEMHMTSGFSKIYSAYINNFMIYDGRVGAALGLLVRAFCIQANLPYVPHELQFAWTKGRSTRTRNPSCDIYVFPELQSNKPGVYLENNIRANWLMSAVANKTKSKFANLDSHLRLRALEQALFMIGYDIDMR